MEGKHGQLKPAELSFKDFSRMNMKRHREWPRESSNDAEEWDLNQWGIAIAEEAGEVCGSIKRLNRFRAGYVIKRRKSRLESEQEGLDKIKGEIGGLLVYLDLLAQHIGSNLEECAVTEFNSVSEREGLPHKL